MLFSAVVKTVCVKAIQTCFNRDMRQAQKRAYHETCRNAKGSFDKNWHANYKKRLLDYRRKAQERKELRITFISSL